jgi:hypothetical protein
MEWMLQVADELDDAAGAVRHLWAGLWRDIAIAVTGFVAVTIALAGILRL